MPAFAGMTEKKRIKNQTMQKLKILFWSVVIGLFAGVVASYGFTGPGSNQPLAGNPIFWLLNGSSTYYVNGNVGIGTTTPGYTLDVSGGMRTTATSTFGGNVGIGTASPAARLDVNGSIRTGNDTTTCGSTNAGAVKYTSSSFYGCNGSSWRPIALVPKGSAALPGASCSDILADGQTTSGTYWINPSGTPFQVYCDMTTSGGGWTILLSSANTVNQCTNLGFSGVPSGACSATTAYASGADAGNNSFANLYLSSGNL